MGVWIGACSGGGNGTPGHAGTGGQTAGGGTGGAGGGGDATGGAGGDLGGGGAGGGGGAPVVDGVIAGSFDGQAEEFRDSLSATSGGTAALLSATRTSGDMTESILLSISGSATLAAGGVYACAAGTASVSYQRSTVDDTSYFANQTHGSCTVTVTAIDAVSVAGTFEATVSIGDGTAPIAITNGRFEAPL